MVKCIDAFLSGPEISKTHIQSFPSNEVIDRGRALCTEMNCEKQTISVKC